MLEDLKTLDFYLTSARKAICKWGNRAMLKDEDTISNIAYFMMRADETFDGRGSCDGRRMQWARYGILRSITQYKRNKQRQMQSLDMEISTQNGRSKRLHEVVADESIGSAEEEYLKDNIVDIINSTPTLRDREKVALIRYFLYGDTYRQIGEADKDDISPEAVRQNILTGLEKLRSRMTA